MEEKAAVNRSMGLSSILPVVPSLVRLGGGIEMIKDSSFHLTPDGSFPTESPLSSKSR